MRKTNCLPNQKKYICSFKNCQKSYALKNILLAHLRTHYKIKPFICTYCSKSFNEKGNLKTHIRIHTGERPFTCKKCHKSFKALGQLKDHFISHTGLKPFQCPYCKKFYRRKEILKNHFEIHKKESFFVKNEEKYKEMMDNINKMKNMVLDFDNTDFVYKDVKEKVSNVVNNINSTGSGSETNLSCSMSSNEECKQSFDNNESHEKIKSVKNNSLNRKKEQNEKDENREKGLLIDNTNFIKEECNFNDFLFKNTLDPFQLFQKNNVNKKLPIYPDIGIKNELNLEVNNEKNDVFLCDDDISVESKDFSFQKIPHISEKELGVSSYLNNFNEEKTDKEFDNYDCCSKITNLYFQSYPNMMDINI